MNNPLLAIRCLVYNHEPYLRDCLEGFVMQKTNFRFVAIVHDDCSTDNSASIIREYAEKYPDIFIPIFEIENQYSKHDGSLRRIVDDAVNITGCKYVAMCEGDDYWTDPNKLQKQVDFLESHPEYNICFHNVKVLDIATGQIGDDTITRDVPGTSGIEELAKGNYIHTPSVVFRKNQDLDNVYQKFGQSQPGDYVRWMLCAEKGKIWKMEEPMAVYRVGSGIWSTAKSIKNDLLYLCTLNKLYTSIDDEEVRANLQNQIDGIIESMVHMEKDLRRVQQSTAYRLGKALLKPFGWLKKINA